MILLDFNQIAISSIFAFQNDLKKTSENKEQAVNIIRHAVLSGIKYYKSKYGAQYGEMILCADGKESWRKQVFPYYKANRKKSRDASDLDWKLIFDTISSISKDIQEHFPWRIIHLDRVEGDDIIATLVKWTQDNGYITQGLVEEPQPVLIVSSDGDFQQLHKYSNVKQWSPIQKKVVPKPANLDEFLIEHIVKGDSVDGIPNILSADNVLVEEGVRQNKMTAGKLAKFYALGRDACENETQLRNWDRNRTLVDLDCIPEDIAKQILDTYTSTRPKGDKMSVMNYLIKHKCRLLLDDLESF